MKLSVYCKKKTPAINVLLIAGVNIRWESAIFYCSKPILRIGNCHYGNGSTT